MDIKDSFEKLLMLPVCFITENLRTNKNRENNITMPIKANK